MTYEHNYAKKMKDIMFQTPYIDEGFVFFTEILDMLIFPLDDCLCRCVQAKGEGNPECEKYARYYRSLCPSEWVCQK